MGKDKDKNTTLEHHQNLVNLIQNRCIPLPEQLDTIMVQITDINKHVIKHEKQILDLNKIFYPTNINVNESDYSSTALQHITPQTYWNMYKKRRDSQQQSKHSKEEEEEGDENFFHNILLTILGKVTSLKTELTELKTEFTEIKYKIANLQGKIKKYDKI